MWAGTFNSVGWKAAQATELKWSTPPSLGEIEDKLVLVFALVFFSVELRASMHVSLPVILIFWQVQLLISPLPISCFVFLYIGHTFQQATLHLVH